LPAIADYLLQPLRKLLLTARPCLDIIQGRNRADGAVADTDEDRLALGGLLANGKFIPLS
jgi:hypothetical protein